MSNSETGHLLLVLVSLSLTPAAGGDGRERLQFIGERNLRAIIHEVPGAESHSRSISQLKNSMMMIAESRSTW